MFLWFSYGFPMVSSEITNCLPGWARRSPAFHLHQARKEGVWEDRRRQHLQLLGGAAWKGRNMGTTRWKHDRHWLSQSFKSQKLICKCPESMLIQCWWSFCCQVRLLEGKDLILTYIGWHISPEWRHLSPEWLKIEPINLSTGLCFTISWPPTGLDHIMTKNMGIWPSHLWPLAQCQWPL